MEKTEYATPELVVLGKVQEITQGQRGFGFKDGHWTVFSDGSKGFVPDGPPGWSGS